MFWSNTKRYCISINKPEEKMFGLILFYFILYLNLSMGNSLFNMEMIQNPHWVWSCGLLMIIFHEKLTPPGQLSGWWSISQNYAFSILSLSSLKVCLELLEMQWFNSLSKKTGGFYLLYKVVTCNRWKDSALGRLQAGTGIRSVADKQVTEVTPPW